MKKNVSLLLNVITLVLVAVCVVTLLLPCFSVKVSDLDEERWNKNVYTRSVNEPQRVRFGFGFIINTLINFKDVFKCLDFGDEDEPTPSYIETEDIREKLEDSTGFRNAVMGVFVLFNALTNGAIVWVLMLLIIMLVCILAAIILLVHLVKAATLLIKSKEDVSVKKMTEKFEAAPLISIVMAVVPTLNCVRLMNPKYYGGLDATISVWTVICFVAAALICIVRAVNSIISIEDTTERDNLLTKQMLSLVSAILSLVCLIFTFSLSRETDTLGAFVCLAIVVFAASCLENTVGRYGMFIQVTAKQDLTERKASRANSAILLIVSLASCIINGFGTICIIGLVLAVVIFVLELVYHSKYCVSR